VSEYLIFSQNSLERMLQGSFGLLLVVKESDLVLLECLNLSGQSLDQLSLLAVCVVHGLPVLVVLFHLTLAGVLELNDFLLELGHALQVPTQGELKVTLHGHQFLLQGLDLLGQLGNGLLAPSKRSFQGAFHGG